MTSSSSKGKVPWVGLAYSGEPLEEMLLALNNQATVSSTAARKWIQPRGLEENTASGETQLPHTPDTWVAALRWGPSKPRMTPDPGKLSNKSMFFKSAVSDDTAIENECVQKQIIFIPFHSFNYPGPG